MQCAWMICVTFYGDIFTTSAVVQVCWFDSIHVSDIKTNNQNKQIQHEKMKVLGKTPKSKQNKHINHDKLFLLHYWFTEYPASNAKSGDIVTTLASAATVVVAHPTSRRRWLQIAGSTVCHLTLQRGLRQRTQSVLPGCVDIVAGSSARRSPPDGRNQKTTCKFTITKIKIMFDLARHCCKTTFEAL